MAEGCDSCGACDVPLKIREGQSVTPDEFGAITVDVSEYICDDCLEYARLADERRFEAEADEYLARCDLLFGPGWLDEPKEPS